MKKQQGFTLIELLIVVYIIALLLTILLPAVKQAGDHAKRAVCAVNLHSIHAAMTQYSGDNLDFALPHAFYTDNNPTTSDLFSTDVTRYVRWYRWAEADGTLQYRNFGILYRNGYVPCPEIFYCPAQKSPTFRYDTYIENPSREWGTIPGVDFPGTPDSVNSRVRQGYHYFPLKRHNDNWAQFGNYGLADAQTFLATKSTDLKADWAIMTEIMQTTVFGERICFAHTANIDKDAWGLMTCFGDGGVKFCVDEAIFSDAYWEPWSTGGPISNWWKFGSVWELLQP